MCACSSGAKVCTMSDTKFYPDDELVALVRTLDRAEDAHAFAEDVTQTHPSLATEYRRICPRRADLALCEQRARSGAYGYDAKLKPLRADIALMVSNCVRFNGKEHPLAAVAQGFEHFANAELNNYIASKTGGRRISSLRLQSSGNASLPSEDSNKNSNSAHDGNDRNNKCDESGYGLAAYSHPEASSVSTPTIAELVDLVQLLARREDAGAFEVNVAEAYPELRVAYELACPQQMNLTMMRARAESGYYLQSNTEDAETTTAATRATTAAESALTHSLPEADIDSKDDSESIPPPKQHDSNTAAHSANSNDDDAHHHDTHTRNDNKASEGAQTCTTMHSDTSTTDTSTATNRDHAVGTDDLPSETKTEKAVLRAPVFGHCTADSLPRMRADVELIVRNCVTFNARVEAWVKLARSFQRFAHRKLDDFVIRHAPHLHGSLSGVEKYAQSTSSSISATTGGNVLFNTTGAAAAAPGGVKRRRTSDAGRVPVHPALHTRRFDAAVVAAGMTPSQTYNNKNNDNSGYANNEFAADVDDGIGTNVASYHNEAISCNRPDVCENNSRDAEQDEALTVNPTPLQPPLSIAASLRVRLLRDHVQREHVALRRIGQSVLVRECMMGVTTDREATVKDATSEPHHEERTKEQSQPRDREKEEEHDVSCLQSHHAHAVEREATATATTAADCENDEIAKLPSDAKVLLTSDYAVDTVLDRFVESVRQFYHRQRSRPDFHSVFDFDVHEEQMYVDWARIVREQFNRLVQVLLLYPREAAEASSLVAEYTLCQGEKRLQQQLQAQHEHTDNNKNNTHDSNKQHSGACEKSETERAAVGGTCWSAHLHVSYLVRFLVQLPQIASLCCATASQGMPPQHHSPLPAGGSALAAHDAVVLCISKDALAMLKRVTKITSECLQFIADYENCLAQQIASSALSPQSSRVSALPMPSESTADPTACDAHSPSQLRHPPTGRRYIYTCRRCRTLLFRDEDRLLHGIERDTVTERAPIGAQESDADAACTCHNSNNSRDGNDGVMADANADADTDTHCTTRVTDAYMHRHAGVTRGVSAAKDFRYRRSVAPLQETHSTSVCGDLHGTGEGAVTALPDKEAAASLSCTSYFVDPDRCAWVTEAGNASSPPTASDTLYCRNAATCGAKIGTQSWFGLRCSCGEWVTPAFKILARAVDRMAAEEHGA